MKWIYLSPHLDDAVFSCGGLIWEQTSSGDQVEIWTICAGDPPDRVYSPFALQLHMDWGLTENMIKIRREEDQKACQILGVTPRYLTYLDCVYRKSPQGEYYYQSEEDIFGGLNPQDMSLIDIILEDLSDQLPSDARIIAPLGIGNHVDHDLIRKVASRLDVVMDYYTDYPYVRESEGKEIITMLDGSSDWEKEAFVISDEARLKWISAAQAYKSQTPIFWEDQGSLLREIGQLIDDMGGVILWKTV